MAVFTDSFALYKVYNNSSVDRYIHTELTITEKSYDAANNRSICTYNLKASMTNATGGFSQDSSGRWYSPWTQMQFYDGNGNTATIRATRLSKTYSGDTTTGADRNIDAVHYDPANVSFLRGYLSEDNTYYWPQRVDNIYSISSPGYATMWYTAVGQTSATKTYMMSGEVAVAHKADGTGTFRFLFRFAKGHGVSNANTMGRTYSIDHSITLTPLGKPTINRSTYVITSTGYDVYTQVTPAAGTTITKVAFPTWTNPNGQDDLPANWHLTQLGTAGSYTVGGQTYNYKFSVPASAHNNEYQQYVTHIYAYGSNGEYSAATGVNLINLTYAVNYNIGNGNGGSASNQTKNYNVALTLRGSSYTKNNATITNNRTEQAITLSYNANNGTGAPSANTGSGITVPGSYTRSYSQSGWATSSGGAKVYNLSASYTSNAAVTLYPSWTETNGTTSYTATSASVTVSSTQPTRTGYTFKGWSTSSTATTASYAAGATYSEKITASKTVTLYAVWQINTWTVSYNANGHGTAPSSQTKTYGTNLTLRSFIANQGSAPSASSYTITANANGGSLGSGSNGSATCRAAYNTYSQTYWNTKSDGTGTNYGSGGTYSANSAATLYAIWKTTNNAAAYTYTLPTYNPTKSSTTTSTLTISYNVNGGTSTTPSNQTSRKTVTYSFSGWYTAASGGTKRTTSSQVTAAETVYAQFSSSTSAQSAITLPAAPTRSGYRFNGWYTAASGGTKVGDAGASWTPDTTRTLYAQWISTSSKVSIHNGSNFNDKYEVYIWNGSSWELYTPYIWNGSSWILYGE